MTVRDDFYRIPGLCVCCSSIRNARLILRWIGFYHPARTCHFFFFHRADFIMVRTRFAPSPTGYMHIGGMRTALFNWLWARHNGGQFVLRIDDTDQDRHVEEALAPILAAFRWLGLDWDEGPEIDGPHGPYYQSQRANLYSAAIEKLLAEGKAFRCYNTPEENQADREASEKAGGARLNVRRSLDLSAAEQAQYQAEGRKFVVRLLVPRDQKLKIQDLVRGEVEWDLAQLADPAIARGDGSALYNLACVVDDAAMQISHVIRAEEHLSNTPTQCLLHQALGYEPPVFAHIPFVTAPGTSKKLSKRDVGKYRNNPQFRKMFDAGDRVFARLGLGTADDLNPVMTAYYESIGYLPAGVLNALARLGWSLDDKTEYFSREELIAGFTLDRVIKSPAGFDCDKLQSYQAHWMGELSREAKIAGCLPFLIQAKLIANPPDEETQNYVGQVIDALAERLVIFGDVLNAEDFFLPDDGLAYDEKAFAKRLTNAPEAVGHLKGFREKLAAAEAFDPVFLETLLKDYCEEAGIKLGDVIHAIRISTTGKAQGPGLFDCLAVLGQQRCLARIDHTLSRISVSP